MKFITFTIQLMANDLANPKATTKMIPKVNYLAAAYRIILHLVTLDRRSAVQKTHYANRNLSDARRLRAGAATLPILELDVFMILLFFYHSLDIYLTLTAV